MDKELLKLEDKKFLANKANRAENTGKILEKLDELKPKEAPEKMKMELVNEPNDLAKAFFSMLRGEKGEQGEKGEAGEKGADSEVPGIQGEKGEKGEKGDIGKPGKDGRDGMDGKDGENGKDGKDGKDADEKKILEKLKEKEIHIKEVRGVDEVLQQVGNSFLQQAKGFVSKTLSGMADVLAPNPTNGQVLSWDATLKKWKPTTSSGSGIVVSVVGGSGISVDSTDPANPIVAATGGGFTKLTATGTIDGSNKAFVFTQKPTYIVSDHAWYQTVNAGPTASPTTNWTWNAGTSTATMAVPPLEDIFGVA